MPPERPNEDDIRRKLHELNRAMKIDLDALKRAQMNSRGTSPSPFAILRAMRMLHQQRNAFPALVNLAIPDSLKSFFTSPFKIELHY